MDKTSTIYRLTAQVQILKDVAQDYPGRTIENIIDNINARLKVLNKEVIRQDHEDLRMKHEYQLP